MQCSIWNMYSSMCNGSFAHRKSVICSKNSLCLKILNVLYKEGYINGFRRCPKSLNNMEIFLKYNQGKPVIHKIQAISKPGRRTYLSVNALWKLETTLFTLVLSTPRGVLSDKECRKFHQGGEVLCVVF